MSAAFLIATPRLLVASDGATLAPVSEASADELVQKALRGELASAAAEGRDWLGELAPSTWPRREAERLLGDRQLFWTPRHAWPTTAASLAARAAVVRELSPRRVLLNDDIDGLSLLCGEGCVVELASAAPMARTWLKSRGAMTLAETDPPVDVAVVSLASPGEAPYELARAARRLVAGGALVISARECAREAALGWLSQWGAKVERELWRCERYVLPGGFCGDDAGGLVVARAGATPELPREPDTAALRRALPYSAMDFDALAPERLDFAALEGFARALALLAPRLARTERLTRGEGQHALVWLDEAGYGLFAELSAETRRLTVDLMPYDAALDWALRVAARLALGDSFTRVRTHLLSRAGAAA